MTVVYTFLVVFLLLMSTLLISYINRSNYSGKLASDTKNYLNSKTSFTIQMNVPNGTASPVSKNIAMGGTSTFTITPSSGYTLEGASVTCEQATASLDTSTGVVTVSDVTQAQTCTVVLQSTNPYSDYNILIDTSAISWWGDYGTTTYVHLWGGTGNSTTYPGDAADLIQNGLYGYYDYGVGNTGLVISRGLNNSVFNRTQDLTLPLDHSTGQTYVYVIRNVMGSNGYYASILTLEQYLGNS